MSGYGYLEGYGEGEERREKLTKRLILGAVLLLIASAAAWFFFRDFREKRQVRLMFDLLERKDYPAAYRLWGCSAEQPCQSYTFEKFMEDWGPKSEYANIRAAKVTKTRSCSAGLIEVFDHPTGGERLLYIMRADGVIGYAPWPSCNPHMPAPTMTPTP